MDLTQLRLSYKRESLTESDVSADPLEQFGRWFQQAKDSGNSEPNAMALATASATGIPNARVVLLKGFSTEGFLFYTNGESRKGVELGDNPRAALLFYWPELERQVRIGGTVRQISREQTERYFQSRPRGHQLGAWASNQSSVVPGREWLERRFLEAEMRFPNEPIPLPPFWNGYAVQPSSMEFWQGRENRVHDRLEYVLQDGEWRIQRLSP